MASITYIGAVWCLTCKQIKPSIQKLASQFGVQLTILDYDSDLSTTEQDTIQKVPTIRIYMNEVLKATYDVNQVNQVEAWLTSNVKLHDAEF